MCRGTLSIYLLVCCFSPQLLAELFSRSGVPRQVIDALAAQRQHIPYRDSVLTRVLEESLGGNCRTTLLVTASACAQHADVTLSSLRFATRTREVLARACKQQAANPPSFGTERLRRVQARGSWAIFGRVGQWAIGRPGVRNGRRVEIRP